MKAIIIKSFKSDDTCVEIKHHDYKVALTELCQLMDYVGSNHYGLKIYCIDSNACKFYIDGTDIADATSKMLLEEYGAECIHSHTEENGRVCIAEFEW
ncbi:MAG: hypothetical protein E7167_01510 [Firmicutes bacterium]|nr:hypothetical protein [Bacillota bacterium]